MKKSVLLSTVITISLAQAACSLSSLNPFDGKPKARGKYPENAVQYRCDDNKRFAVLQENQGNNAWLIYPDHQVNLDLQSTENTTQEETSKDAVPAGKKVYESGAITLTLEGDQATLQNGDTESFTGCKAQVMEEK